MNGQGKIILKMCSDMNIRNICKVNLSACNVFKAMMHTFNHIMKQQKNDDRTMHRPVVKTKVDFPQKAQSAKKNQR